jgi:Tol biopolymer transport system component
MAREEGSRGRDIILQPITTTSLMICQSCGAENPLKSKVCRTCGVRLYEDMPGPRCPVCLAPLKLASVLGPGHIMCNICYSEFQLVSGSGVTRSPSEVSHFNKGGISRKTKIAIAGIIVFILFLVLIGFPTAIQRQPTQITETTQPTLTFGKPTLLTSTQQVLFLGDRVDMSAEPFGFMGTLDTYTLYTINLDGSGKTKISEKVIFHPPWAVPSWSPDGKKILYTQASTEEKRFFVYVASPDGMDRRKIAAGLHWSWSPDGEKILYDDRQWLYVINIDGRERVRLLDIAYYNIENISWSHDGKKILVRDSERHIYLVNIDGTHKAEFYGDRIFLSPDWMKVCIVDINEYLGIPSRDYDIYIANTDGTGMLKIAEKLEGFKEAIWTPDSKKLLIVAGPSSFIIDADGNGKSVLKEEEANKLKSQWYPKKEGVLLEWENGYIYRVNTDGTKTRLVEAERSYALSPDGRMIAYSYRDQFGDYHLYVINIDGSDKRELAKSSSEFLGILWRPK